MELGDVPTPTPHLPPVPAPPSRQEATQALLTATERFVAASTAAETARLVAFDADKEYANLVQAEKTAEFALKQAQGALLVTFQ